MISLKVYAHISHTSHYPMDHPNAAAQTLENTWAHLIEMIQE